MQRDEPSNEGQTATQTALSAIGRSLSLHEQIKHPWQELGRDAEAVVLYT
jgi:hypothetical protein